MYGVKKSNLSRLALVEPLLEGVAGNAAADGGIEFSTGLVHAIKSNEDIGRRDDKA